MSNAAYAEKTCMVCNGSGRLVLRRSWFPSDGYSACRCGICKGTGLSSYVDHEYAASQRALRAEKNSSSVSVPVRRVITKAGSAPCR
jgi:DnaJ-class molecular chaperone